MDGKMNRRQRMKLMAHMEEVEKDRERRAKKAKNKPRGRKPVKKGE